MSEMVRLIRYSELLSNRRFLTKQELMEVQEVSLATFKRDIAKLRDQMNVPIVFDRELGGYRLDKNSERTELPGFWFSQDEILALLTIQGMISELEPGLLGPKIKPLQDRLNSILTNQGLDADTLTQRVRLLQAGKRRMPLKSFETVAKATLERKQVEVLHFNRQNGVKAERVISPQQLLYYRDNWYVDAWCHLRGGVRSFAIDAFETAEILDKPARELDPPTLKKNMNGGYGTPDARIDITTWQANGQTCIQVADNGPGIAPDEKAQIFNLLKTSKAQGTGIGLWLSRQLIERHGGHLTIEPSASGAQFLITFPKS